MLMDHKGTDAKLFPLKKSYSFARFFEIAINDFQNKLLLFFTKIYSRTMSSGKENILILLIRGPLGPTLYQ